MPQSRLFSIAITCAILSSAPASAQYRNFSDAALREPTISEAELKACSGEKVVYKFGCRFKIMANKKKYREHLANDYPPVTRYDQKDVDECMEGMSSTTQQLYICRGTAINLEMKQLEFDYDIHMAMKQ